MAVSSFEAGMSATPVSSAAELLVSASSAVPLKAASPLPTSSGRSGRECRNIEAVVRHR